MADERLRGSDKRVLLLWVLCGLIGALFAQRYFFRAFPEASVDFKVSRADAQVRAKQFVEGLGENLNGYESTIVFDVDENAKTYLERELGLQQANQLMSGQLNIWYWDVRFFRPKQEEEFLVRSARREKWWATTARLKKHGRRNLLAETRQRLRRKNSRKQNLAWT